LTCWERDLRTALRIGLTRDAYWNLTRREFWQEVQAWQWREKRRNVRAVLGGWYAGALSRVGKLPSLADTLAPYEPDDEQATPGPDAQATADAAAVVAWNGVFRLIGEAQERREQGEGHG